MTARWWKAPFARRHAAPGVPSRRDGRKRGGDRRGEAGFTLVEMLVASAILGLVALLLVNGMRFVRKAQASADARREAVEGTVVGIGLTRGTLGRALPVFRKVENREELLFEGGEDRLRFVIVESDYLPGWPLVAYEYAFAYRGGRHLLEVRRATVDPGAPSLDGLDEAEPRALLAFAEQPRFGYYGRLRPKQPVGWQAEWREAELLPEGVRLGPAGDEPGWPDLVVTLRVNTPVSCLTRQAPQAQVQTQAAGEGGQGRGQGCGG